MKGGCPICGDCHYPTCICPKTGEVLDGNALLREIRDELRGLRKAIEQMGEPLPQQAPTLACSFCGGVGYHLATCKA